MIDEIDAKILNLLQDDARTSNAELAEEAPLAYKDVDRVADVVHEAGIARRVARLVPLGVVKG